MLRREIPVIRQIQAQIDKLGLLKSHFEQVTTIKETHAVLTTVRDHLNQNEDTSLPNLDGVSDLQEALAASHSVFEDIDEVLKETWAGETPVSAKRDLEAELDQILGITTTSQPPPPSNKGMAPMEKITETPPLYQPSDLSSPFPTVPTTPVPLALSESRVPVLEL
jgi:hypothetical protein